MTPGKIRYQKILGTHAKQLGGILYKSPSTHVIFYFELKFQKINKSCKILQGLKKCGEGGGEFATKFMLMEKITNPICKNLGTHGKI